MVPPPMPCQPRAAQVLQSPTLVLFKSLQLSYQRLIGSRTLSCREAYLYHQHHLLAVHHHHRPSLHMRIPCLSALG